MICDNEFAGLDTSFLKSSLAFLLEKLPDYFYLRLFIPLAPDARSLFAFLFRSSFVVCRFFFFFPDDCSRSSGGSLRVDNGGERNF